MRKNRNLSIRIDQRKVPIRIKRNRVSKSINLSIHPLTQCVHLTIPTNVSLYIGLNYLKSQRTWLRNELKELLLPVPFQHKKYIPFKGKKYCIVHKNSNKEEIIKYSKNIYVYCKKNKISKNVLKWLKQNAKKEIKRKIAKYSSHLNVKVKSIFIKDMITKWGSCSTKKDLTFSWRIIFFPNYVSNYIIAHEVAHLLEFNHSKKFWNNVKKIYGNFKSANDWMEKNSKKFYRYGINN